MGVEQQRKCTVARFKLSLGIETEMHTRQPVHVSVSVSVSGGKVRKIELGYVRRRQGLIVKILPKHINCHHHHHIQTLAVKKAHLLTSFFALTSGGKEGGGRWGEMDISSS